MSKEFSSIGKKNLTMSAKSAGVVSGKEKKNLTSAPARNKQKANGVDRHEMIAMSAYYRSQKRDFNNGDEIQDWLEAEAEVDGLI